MRIITWIAIYLLFFNFDTRSYIVLESENTKEVDIVREADAKKDHNTYLQQEEKETIEENPIVINLTKLPILDGAADCHSSNLNIIICENRYLKDFDINTVAKSNYDETQLANVMWWIETVQDVYDEHQSEFTALADASYHDGLSVLQVMLGLIYQESGGDRTVMVENGTDNTYGLTQMNPNLNSFVPEFHHLYINKTTLLNRNQEFNIYIGMLNLNRLVETVPDDYVNEFYSSKDHSPKLFWALAYYNCGSRGVDGGTCYWWGGEAYAIEILEKWLPALNYYYDTKLEGTLKENVDWR